MKAKEIKTIHIITKTWFDKVNGNTYFAQMIWLNMWEKNQTEVFNYFQYGYSSYRHFAIQRIAEYLGCKKEDITTKKIFDVTIRNCKKSELTERTFCGNL